MEQLEVAPMGCSPEAVTVKEEEHQTGTHKPEIASYVLIEIAPW
jgi:hypothetical protein